MEAEAFGHSPKDALRSGLVSGPAWTALVNGRPEAMFGNVVVSALEGLGRPWFLGTDEVYRHGREMLVVAPRFVAAFFDSTPRLGNLVSAANGRAIRLLRRWGFVVEEQETMIGGVAFRAFHGERR